MEAIFITARLKSTRLIKKVLLEVAGQPVLHYLVERIKFNFKGKIIICTSINAQDEELINFSKNEKIEIFRGSEEDVIERYYETCLKFNIDRFYVCYGDEPFIDIRILKKNLFLLDANKKMWIDNSNSIDGTFGYGMTFKAIEYANKNKKSRMNEVWGKMISAMDIEKQILPPLYKNIDKNTVRLTIDYPEDFEVFKFLISQISNDYLSITIPDLVYYYRTFNLFKINGSRIIDYYKRIDLQANS